MIRHGLDEILYSSGYLKSWRFFYYIAPWNWFGKSRKPRGIRIRQCLEELGPVFVKFGQILSTRRDLLPDDISDELSRLQDDVPPFPGEQAVQSIESAYGKPLSELYCEFDDNALASASIAQVHAATLHTGQKVVVKVIRPGIEKRIQRDIRLMYYIAQLLSRFWADGKRLRPVEVVKEFEKTILAELDLVREAANASQLRRNFENSEKLYVPEVYWPLATKKVLTLERIHGTPVNDIQTLNSHGIDIQKLAETGVEIFYTQVFKHNFFHADMHPGNIFVADDGQYIAVDFGIMGTLTEQDQHYLAENFIAFFNRDYRRVAELHAQSGWVPEDTRLDEFEAEVRTVCEPNFNKPLKDISFAQVLLRLFDTARRFNIEIQPQLLLMQKTLLNIEGLGRQLYPDLDLWKTAKPFLENWMSEQVGLKHFINALKKETPKVINQLPELPTLLYEFLKNSNNHHSATTNQRDLKKIEATLRMSHNKTRRSIFGASLLISSAIIFTSNLMEITAIQIANPLIALGGLIFLLSGLRK